MITATFDTKKFMRDMNNIMNYAVGFLDGVERGKPVLLKKLGAVTVQVLKEYIDSNARVNPAALQHVYEWYKVGSPEARLFDIDYVVTGLGISIGSTFRQSQAIKAGSSTPFYNKASIMEQGVPVKIRPKKSNYLVFQVEDKTVFTQNDITVRNPGGAEAAGSYEKTLDSFFLKYFSQAFLGKSGILAFLSDPSAFKKNLPAGKSLGRSAGLTTGYEWVTNLDEVV